MNVEEFSGSLEEWSAFLERNRGGILQTAEWGAFRRSLGWKARLFTVGEAGKPRLQAMVLQKPLPLGFCFFYAPEGPIVRDGNWNDPENQRAFAMLHEHLKDLAKQERALFLKVDPHYPAEEFPLDWLSGLGYRDSPEDIQAAIVAHVDLKPDEPDILAAMKQKGRYNIRYAERKGVQVRVASDQKALDDFYSLHEATAKRQEFTYRNREYFERFREFFMEKSDRARFVTAEADGQPVAAILVTFTGEEAIYLYGGTAPQDRNLYASYLVQWAGMREAKRRGCTLYNMTGVSATDDPSEAWYGLRQFKLKFGAEVLHLVGARDFPYRRQLYSLFTNADRARRLIAKRTGL